MDSIGFESLAYLSWLSGSARLASSSTFAVASLVVSNYSESNILII
jgi:hypothetical protein